MTENDNRLKLLNHLADLNRDSEEAFLGAADRVKNSELDTQFTDYARQHARFAAELEAELAKLEDGRPERRNRPGALKRGWIDLKAALTGNSAGAILSSCQSGENTVLAAYDQAEAEISTGQIYTLLQKQHQQIAGFRTRLARLVGESKDGVEFPDNE